MWKDWIRPLDMAENQLKVVQSQQRLSDILSEVPETLRQRLAKHGLTTKLPLFWDIPGF